MHRKIGGVEVVLAASRAEGGRDAAAWICERAAAVTGRRPVLGLATGRSTDVVYGELVRRMRAGRPDPASLESFNLDEYLGLPSGDPASFECFMEKALFEPAGMDRAHCHFPEVRGIDPVQSAAAYERAIAAAGGVDVQLLGIGVNGHIGFNEPGSDRHSRTREVRLSPATREQNAGAFGGDSMRVPERAITMGIDTILEARAIVLVAWGASKAQALRRALHGAVSSAVPASFLREHPGPVRIVADPAAAASLA